MLSALTLIADPTPDPSPMRVPSEEEFAACATFMNAIGHPIRLKVLWRIARGDVEAHEIFEFIGVPNQTTSHHMTNLRLVGLIMYRHEGKDHIYSLTEKGRQLMAIAPL